MSRINIEIPNSDHQMLRIVAAATTTSVKDLVLSAIRDKIRLECQKQPNEETLMAFKETDTGKGLVKHSNISSLLEDLGLHETKSN
ncbi:MAG: hypothetical protein ACHP6I_03400 [Rickettsiales bacterium]